MRNSEVQARVDRAKVDIDLLRRQLPHVLAKLAEYSSSGFTTSKGDNVGGGAASPGMSSSPVERAAATPDPAADCRRRFERNVLAMNALLDELVRDAQWATRVEREGADGAKPGCSIMALVNVWEPATLTTAGGNLIEPQLLGVWAKRWVQRHGRLPTRVEAGAHAQGRRPQARAS